MNAKLVSAGLSMCILLAGAIRPAEGRVSNPPSPSSADSDDSEKPQEHPYAAIINRNVFRLVPIPPPAPASPQDDPAANNSLKLTGFMKSSGQPIRALFVNSPKSATNSIYYNLSSGERDGALELIRVNETEESADVVLAGIRQTVYLKDNKPAGSPAAASPGANSKAVAVVRGGPQTPPPVAAAAPASEAQPYTGGVFVSGGLAVPSANQASDTNAAGARSVPTRVRNRIATPLATPAPQDPAGAQLPAAANVSAPPAADDAAESIPPADATPQDQPDQSARKFRR